MKDQLKTGMVVILMGAMVGMFLATVKMSSKHNFKRLELICKDICKNSSKPMVSYDMNQWR